MVHPLFYKIILVLLASIAVFFAYQKFQKRAANSPASSIEQITEPTTDNQTLAPAPTDNTTTSLNPNEPPTISNPSLPSATNETTSEISTEARISPAVDVQGDILAHITPEHCSNNCQAFKIDLKLFEYCEQSCGISPIKKVSDCNGKKELEKDYCNKDLAVIKKDISLCEKIKDANIKQACKNRISQDIIESLQ